MLTRAAERRDNLGAMTALLLRLLDQYGAGELEIAIRDALDRDVPHPNAVRLALERRSAAPISAASKRSATSTGPGRSAATASSSRR